MFLPTGTRVGPYEIVAAIGQGGMGQVYRARDTKLDRDVALKILPQEFAADGDRVMRFTREAKTLASLNHPNIAQVYDAGREGSQAFIAMEFVQGEDLSARIHRGPLPLAEALGIARQVADALSVAHDHGIVHRDLKPANIKITDDDVVKVLDFGLAKGLDQNAVRSGSHAGSEDPASLATRTSPAMTAMGLILGTASYMSPEQAKGKPVDRRADVWAFGVVLYEMLTGAFLFGREDITDTLAAVLTHEPDLAKLPPATPTAIKRLLIHCLAKDKRQRLDSMTAARIEIEDVLGGRVPEAASGSSVKPARTTWLTAAALVAAGVVIGSLAALSWPRTQTAGAAASTLVAQVAAPLETISAFHDGFALSPDGSTLAFAARNAAGLRQIWIRRLDAEAARALPGTDGATHPFWAHDNRSVAFFSDAKLRRVDLDGSRLQTICEASGAFESGSWNERDEILWSANRGDQSRVFKVPASGGTPVPFDALDVSIGPTWLADGRRFFFVKRTATPEPELRLASADGQTSEFIATLPAGIKQYAYARGMLFLNKNDTLTVQSFDEQTGALTGSPVPISPVAGKPKEWFAVSSDGKRVLAAVRQSPTDTGDPGDPMARLRWVDRQGNTLGTLGDPGRYWTLRLTPDGARAAVNPGPDLWLLRADGRHTRLTTGGAQRQSYAAVWNHDGSELTFLRRPGIVRRPLDPQSEATDLTGARGTLHDWSPDDRWLLTVGRATDQSTTLDILAYDFQSKSVRNWLASPFTETHPRFSPDGRWVAYTSNLSGRDEVYLRKFEGDAAPVPVSTQGGGHPQWRRDGNELFFLNPADEMMSVSVTRSGETIITGAPQRLFRIPLNDITRASYSPYGVTPDGQRFLLNVPDRPTPLFFLQGLEGLVGKK